ncbi:MAG: hypothetical protein K5Q00_04665 [Gammaproteobacteria bacterium]|nr:hypothetical protein [Gammaproteobacteria bacterium]
MTVNSSGLYKGNRNLIRGGNFSGAAWTYAVASGTNTSTGLTGVTVSANGNRIPDGWIVGGSTTAAAVTASVAVDGPTFAQSGVEPIACLSLACTTADSSVAAGDLFYVGTAIDQADCTYISSDYFTLSFWVKTTITGQYSIRFAWNGSTQLIMAATYTVNAADTWEYKTVTILTPNVIAGSAPAVCGLKINFNLMAGSNYNITANTWTTYSATNGNVSGSVNALSSTSNIFKLALVQLEKGQVATQFDLRLTTEDILNLQPWAESVLSGWYQGAQVAAATVQAPVSYKTLKIKAANEVVIFDVTGPTAAKGDWISIAGASNSRTTTSTNTTKSAFSLQQAVALDYLVNCSWWSDHRSTLFTF